MIMVDFLSILGNLLLFCLVFGMSATVDLKCMKKSIQNVKAILAGMFCQFLILPLLGFLVVKALKLNHAVGITLLVVTSSPGGSYSNWWCSLFNADLALSVTITAVSTIFSTVTLPSNLLIYTRLTYKDDVIKNLDWSSLFVALFVVISAIVIGLYCSYRFKSYEFNQRANQLGNVAGLTLMLFSATVTNTGNADSKIWSREWSFYVGVALPCLLGLVIANVVGPMCNLKQPERVTVAVECCYQNIGIATSMALSMFEGDELNDSMGVPFLYGMTEMVLVGCYCLLAWKMGWTRAPSDVSLWKAITTSYEVLEAQRLDLSEIEISYRESDENMPIPEDEKSEDGRTLTHYYNASFSSGLGAPAVSKTSEVSKELA